MTAQPKFAIRYFVGAKRGFYITGNDRYDSRGVAEMAMEAQLLNERRNPDITSIRQSVVEVQS